MSSKDSPFALTTSGLSSTSRAVVLESRRKGKEELSLPAKGGGIAADLLTTVDDVVESEWCGFGWFSSFCM